MFTENFISWLLFKAFDDIDDKIKSQKQTKALCDRINELLNKKREEFENVSLSDEFDFQGLEEYIKDNMAVELTMFFRGTQQQRKESEKNILIKATNYASAKTSGAKNMVSSIIMQVLQVINDYYVNQIDTTTRINTNMAVDEVIQKIDDSTQELKETINHNNPNSINDTVYSRKLDILKAIEKYELPDYQLDICPKKISHNNPEISKAEMSVLFNGSPRILTDFSSLLLYIDETDKQISEIMQFYRGYCEPDGYGGWKNDVWDKILYYEDLLGKPYCSDDTIREYEEYCNQNPYSEYIPELDEYHTINYYIVKRRISDILSEFNSIKKRLISLISKDIT